MFDTQRVQCVIDLLQSVSASASALVHHTNPKPKIPSIQTLFQLPSQTANLQFNSNSTQVRTSPSFLFPFFCFLSLKKQNCFTSISRFILETLDSLLDLVCSAVENMQERKNFMFLVFWFVVCCVCEISRQPNGWVFCFRCSNFIEIIKTPEIQGLLFYYFISFVFSKPEKCKKSHL